MKTSASVRTTSFLLLCLLVFAAMLSLTCTRAPAQAAGVDYTTDLPSVARVEAEIKGSDPTDTLARQVAVFNYLLVYIDRTKYNRTVRGPYTPGEQKMYSAYSAAGYQLSQDYTKSHTAAEVTAFNQLHGRYEMDETFNDTWQKQLIGPLATAAYNGAVNSLAAGPQAHVAQEQQQYQQDVAAQQAGTSGMSADPTSVAARRCLELGGTTTACVGSSLMGGIISTFTGGTDLSALTGPGRAGVVLSGTYGQSATAANITFSGDSAAIANCGKLVADGHGYTLVKAAGPLKVSIANQPNPIVLTMRSDGSLAGPGAVTVTGRVVVGHLNVTHYANGVATGTTSIPTYGPATASCAIGSLAAPPPIVPSSDSAPPSGIFGVITGIAGTVAPPSLPGLRMEGKYFSSSGLILDFAGDAVTMDCGQAHIKAPYTVANNPASFTVSVQNPGGPFGLAIASNNTLAGSGSTAVNGRLVSGMNGDNITFTPHAESCAVATFTPQAAASSSSVAASSSPVPAAAPAVAAPVSTLAATVPAPAAPGASMKLNVTSTFPTAANPLAGKPVTLMTDRFDNALRSVGAPIPPGTTPGHALQAWASACNPPKNCTAAAKLMARFYVGRGTFDSTGTVLLTAPVAPGTYYVFSSLAGTKGVLVWDLQTTLKAGDNTVNLTATNAELVQ